MFFNRKHKATLRVDEQGVAVFEKPRVYFDRNSEQCVILFGIHLSCESIADDEDEHAAKVVGMFTPDDVFNLIFQCNGCDLHYHMELNDDDALDFTAWALDAIRSENGE